MYYIGFLKKSKKHAVIFRSVVVPKKTDMTYFLKVMGPYRSEGAARRDLTEMKIDGYSENPIKGLITKDGVRKAVALTRKVYRLYGVIKKEVRKENPGQEYHDRKFMLYMKELEKYAIGSSPYIATLAKAYEHLECAKDSMHEERVR